MNLKPDIPSRRHSADGKHAAVTENDGIIPTMSDDDNLSGGPQTPEGKRKAAGNAQTHGLTADPSKYHERLPPDEREFVLDVSAAIEDRIRRNQGRDLDYLDRILARRVAIHLHIASNAAGYVADEGLMESVMTPDGRIEVPNRLLEELRRFDKDLVRTLKDIGAVDDGAKSDVDALVYWRNSLE